LFLTAVVHLSFKTMARIVGLALVLGALAALVTCFVPGLPGSAPAARQLPKGKDWKDGRDRFSGWSEQPVAKAEVQNQGTSWGLRASAAAALALLLALLPMDAAEAARSGGRMGGSSRGFAAQPPPRAAVPRGGTARGSAGPRISIGIGAPMISPFGYAPLSPFSPFGYGGFGLGVPVPLGPVGPSVNDQMLQNQQAQDERKIDEQKQEIAALKKELEDLKLKK